MTSRALAGFTIGVTADRRADEQATLFERQGATVLYGPTVRVAPVAEIGDLLTATREMIARPPDHLVLLSAFGVECWLETAAAMGLDRELREAIDQTEVWSRGTKPVGAAIVAGLSVANVVEGHEALLEQLLAVTDGAADVALVLDGSGVCDGLERLEASGLTTRSIESYHYDPPSDLEPALRLLRSTVDGQVDAVTFTSRPAVERFAELADGDGVLDDVLAALRERCVPVCVGPASATAAAKLGLHPVVPERSRLGVLVHAAACELSSRSGSYEVYGVEFAVQGRLVKVAGQELVLSDRERHLLDALRRAEGRVISKAELLRDVWQGDSDPHVVEVNVARLRRRLGPASDAIETVYRRGYRWSGVKR